ncbi:MAG: TonB-dependent receptor [Terriglobia bacterium]
MNRALACTVSCLLLIAGLVRAQTNRATITGTVRDSSGAVVPEVTVTATDVATRISTAAITNGAGIYTLLNLVPAQYRVEFEKRGFKLVVEPDITLHSTQVAQINARLEVGALTQQVTVTTQAPVLDKETATIGTNMNNKVVTDLPLSIYGGGRFVEEFAVALTPGYSQLSSPYGSVINGNQQFTKDYTIDGTSGTAQIQGDSMETGPPMEAVQELQAQTSGINAQSGITSGGVIAFTMKSGTNQFHGSGFVYGDNEALDANTWDNNNQGLPKATDRRWDYGGSFGGPIIRNKTFFFGSFERYTQRDFAPGGFGSASTVPTSAFLNGDFSALLNPSKVYGVDSAGNTIYQGAIFNPATGEVFVGNKIPSSMFSPVAQKIIALYQKSYAPENGNLINNDRLPSSNSPAQTPNTASLKIDENLRSTDHLDGSWIYHHQSRTLVDSGGLWQVGSTTGGPLADARLQLVPSDQFRASETHTFAPNILNVLNATYNWYWNGSTPAATGTNWPSTLGFGNTGSSNFPKINFGSSVNGIGETFVGNTWQGNYVSSTFILGDSVSWMKGRHTFTFGGDFRAEENNYHAGSGALTFNFSNNTTGALGKSYGANVGFGFASFLLGNVQTASETTPEDLYGRRKAMDYYAQDNWKVTPKLTLNLGLRWDVTFPLHEKYGHWANFDLNSIDPNLGIPGELVYAGFGTSFEKEYWKNIGPQVGFAYSPWQKVVFRGSFGILYVPIGIQYWTGVPYGFAPGYQGTDTASSPFNWNSGYPGVFVPGTKSTTPAASLFPVVNVDPNSLEAGYTDAFNVGVEYQLTPGMRLSANYIGNRGHRLQDSALNYNEPSPSAFFNLVNAGTNFTYACSAKQAAAVGVPYPYAGFCAPAAAAIAPFPQVASALDTYWYYPNLYYVGLPRGQSYYDSMVLDLDKRTGNGLMLDVNYTLSRQETDTYTNFGESYDTSYIQNLDDLSFDAHTLSPYDQTSVIKGFVSYELPFGPGRRWLHSSNRVVNAMAIGWTVSELFGYATGQPISFGASNPYYPEWANVYVDYNLAGYNGNTFNRVNFNPAGGPGNRYFPTSIASNPPYGQLGTGKRLISQLRCPGADSEDANLLKDFPFGQDGRFNLQFRAEFYNLLNRHSYTLDGCASSTASPSNSNFGQVLGVTGSPRTGQFAIRFTF